MLRWKSSVDHSYIPMNIIYSEENKQNLCSYIQKTHFQTTAYSIKNIHIKLIPLPYLHNHNFHNSIYLSKYFRDSTYAQHEIWCRYHGYSHHSQKDRNSPRSSKIRLRWQDCLKSLSAKLATLLHYRLRASLAKRPNQCRTHRRWTEKMGEKRSGRKGKIQEGHYIPKSSKPSFYSIIGWELYFKNKKILEQIMSVSK